MLEPRLLLNADAEALLARLPVDPPGQAALIVDGQRELGSGGAAGAAPVLPGMELQEADLTRLRGQIVYLDFAGQEDVSYDGPVAAGPLNVPAFVAPGPLAGTERAIEAEIRANLQQLFGDAGVIFTLERPAADQPYSTVYIGGNDAAFAAYGSFDGLAEAVDVGNRNTGDEALVFSDVLAAGAADLASYVARLLSVVAHETGHLLGYAHEATAAPAPGDREDAAPLGAVAHATGPDDDQTAEANGAVHQWLTYNAFLFYDSQFADSELATFLGDWQDYGSRHHRTNGDNNDLIEGVFDEDVSMPTTYLFDNGFHWDIAPQNPLGQDIPYYRHFVAGGDGDAIYVGWNGFASAVTQALSYWQTYVLGTYPVDPALAYYYLGHVVHLLEDMTVPAHVHNDAHPIRDAYEYTMGEHFNYLLWGYGDGVRTAPQGPIETPADLASLFRETIQYTGEYPSDDAGGVDNPEIPNAGLHRPDLVSRDGGFSGDGAALSTVSNNEITILADDLMAWAMEQVAALFRLFYRLVDTTAPVVTLLTSFGGDEADAVLKPDRFHIEASAYDALSGYDTSGFAFTLEHKIGDTWQPLAVDPNSGRFEFAAPGDGLYRVSVEVHDAAGNVGRSDTGYFRVEEAAGLTPVYRFWSPVISHHFYTIRGAERDKLINNYPGAWIYEGVAYYAFGNDTEPGVVPIYRFWSGSLGAHFFTTSAAERTQMIDQQADVWTYEGIAFYVYPDSQPAGTNGVYQFLSHTGIGHFYTISQRERDKLLTFYPLLWIYEDVAWYAYEA
jgi:hypothetical protein